MKASEKAKSENMRLTDAQKAKLETFVERLLTLECLSLFEDKESGVGNHPFRWVYQSGPIQANTLNSGWFGKFIRQFEVSVQPRWKDSEEATEYRFLGASLAVRYDHGNLCNSNGSNGVSADIVWDQKAEDWAYLTNEDTHRLQRKM